MNWLNVVKNNKNQNFKMNNKICTSNQRITDIMYNKNLFDIYLLDKLINNIILLKEDLYENFPYILGKANSFNIVKFLLKYIDYSKTMYNYLDFNENLSDSDNDDS